MTSALEWWRRAERAIHTAEWLGERDPDASVSRAYYAAFYAVTALMALEDRSFRSHHALRIAVHRDLVQAGRWTASEGEAFDLLSALRHTGDYGGATPLAWTMPLWRHGKPGPSSLRQCVPLLDA